MTGEAILALGTEAAFFVDAEVFLYAFHVVLEACGHRGREFESRRFIVCGTTIEKFCLSVA
jgi:hypothetical protein